MGVSYGLMDMRPRLAPHLVKSKVLHKEKLISPGTSRRMVQRPDREIIDQTLPSIFQGIELEEYYYILRSVQQCTRERMLLPVLRQSAQIKNYTSQKSSPHYLPSRLHKSISALQRMAELILRFSLLLTTSKSQKYFGPSR